VIVLLTITPFVLLLVLWIRISGWVNLFWLFLWLSAIAVHYMEGLMLA
jgi:hypothetical protein